MVLNDKNHSLLSESLILGEGVVRSILTFFPDRKLCGRINSKMSLQRVSKEGDVFKPVVGLKNSPCRCEHSQELTGRRSMPELDADPGMSQTFSTQPSYASYSS